VNTPVRFGRNQ